jgi:hypothetical protein
MSNENRPIYINQSRRGVYSNEGTVLYQIVTEVVANSSYTGDTRDSGYLLNLFVQTIVDTEDTTQDTFSNYATLADLDLIPNNRATAVNASMNKYRDNINTLSFDNLSVATTAAQVVRDTINNIVDTYLRVKSDFIGSDTYYLPYPLEVTALRDEYIQAYTASRDARVAAESAQEEAQVSHNSSVAIEQVRSECKDVVCSIADSLASAQTLCQLVGSKYVATMKLLIVAAQADDTTITTVAQLSSWLEDNAVSAGFIHDSNFIEAVDETSGTGLNLLSLILQAATKAVTDCSTMGTNLAAAQQAVASKLSNLKEKQQLKNAAALSEESTLGTLAIYCPNLDPASV